MADEKSLQAHINAEFSEDLSPLIWKLVVEKLAQDKDPVVAIQESVVQATRIRDALKKGFIVMSTTLPGGESVDVKISGEPLGVLSAEPISKEEKEFFIVEAMRSGFKVRRM